MIKVYAWTSRRSDCPPAPNGGQQVRYVVAARSWKAAVATIPGESLNQAMRFGSTTGNDIELDLALANPGQAFWKPLDGHVWRRAL